MNKKIKTAIQSILKIGFAGLLIWWIISTGKIDLQALRKLLSPGFIAVGSVFIFLSIVTCAERWRQILLSQNEYLSFIEALRLTFIGLFFNFAMPGGVGGDVVKAYYLVQIRPQAKVAAITSVLMDRILGLYAMIAMALLVMVLDISHVSRIVTLQNLFYFMILLFISASTFLFLAFSNNMKIKKLIHQGLNYLPKKEKFIKLYESTHLYGKKPSLIFKAVWLSLIAQTFSILFMIYAGENSGIAAVPYSVYFLVTPLGFMATAIPISPAGLGVGQAAFYALFNIYLEKTTALGPTVITALQAMQIMFGFVGAFFYLFKSGHKATAAELEQIS